MEVKTAVSSLLVLVSLVAVGGLEVEAGKACCPNTYARASYDYCRHEQGAELRCALDSGCVIVDTGARCPADYPILVGDAVNEYCKLGCAFSVCGLQNSGEVLNEAVEKCNDACSAVCDKTSLAAMENA